MELNSEFAADSAVVARGLACGKANVNKWMDILVIKILIFIRCAYLFAEQC